MGSVTRSFRQRALTEIVPEVLSTFELIGVHLGDRVREALNVHLSLIKGELSGRRRAIDRAVGCRRSVTETLVVVVSPTPVIVPPAAFRRGRTLRAPAPTTNVISNRKTPPMVVSSVAAERNSRSLSWVHFDSPLRLRYFRPTTTAAPVNTPAPSKPPPQALLLSFVRAVLPLRSLPRPTPACLSEDRRR